MAFSGDGRKLTGVDATIYSGAFGAEQSDSGTLDPGYYIVDAVGAATGFPSNSGATGAEDIKPGYLIKVGTGDTITLASGDTVRPITFTELCDVSGYGLPFTADEIETTTLCNKIKVYEPGKADASGTLTGITTIGTSTGPDSLLRQFIDIVQQDGDTSIDFYEKTTNVLFLYLSLNETTTKGDEIGFFLPVNIYGAGPNVDQAGAQGFDSSFRLTDYAGVYPALYRFAV